MRDPPWPPLTKGGSNLLSQGSGPKIEKVRAIGAGPRDWDFSAVFPIARGARLGGAFEKRSARLRTESDQLGIFGHCDAGSLSGNSECGMRNSEWTKA